MKIISFLLFFFSFEIIFGSKLQKETGDGCSQSNFQSIQQTHLNLNITIDFDKKS